jgi:hypothetical protein
MTVKSTVFRLVTLCSSERTRLFGGKYCLHLRGRRLSKARNQQEQAASFLYVPPKRQGVPNDTALQPRRLYAASRFIINKLFYATCGRCFRNV